jgi:hypothetical protein
MSHNKQIARRRRQERIRKNLAGTLERPQAFDSPEYAPHLRSNCE